MIDKKIVVEEGVDIDKIDLLGKLKEDAMTTDDVAKLLGITVPAANTKLHKLVDEEKVVRKKYANIFHYYVE